MIKILASLIFVIACFALVATGQKGKPNGDAPATSVLQDLLDGNPTSVGSDGFGPYVNGVESVVSVVQGIGNWELSTKLSPSRRVRVDLADPVPGTNPNPPFLTANAPVRFISKCTTSIFTLAAGQSTLCPLAVSIDYAGATYALRSEQTNYPGTEPVTWSCLAQNSGQCVSWRMTPSVVQADGQRKIVMQLLRPATSKRGTDQLLGRFFVSFDLWLTRP